MGSKEKASQPYDEDYYCLGPVLSPRHLRRCQPEDATGQDGKKSGSQWRSPGQHHEDCVMDDDWCDGRICQNYVDGSFGCCTGHPDWYCCTLGLVCAATPDDCQG